mgnify:CR=1 FL=1
MVISRYEFTATPSLGTFTEVILQQPGIIKQIYLSPATSSTTFDFQVLDENSRVIYEMTDCTGRTNELIELPVYSNLSITVSNASANELFTGLIASRTS